MAASIPQFGEVVGGVDYVLRPGGYVVAIDPGEEIAIVATPKGFFLPGGGQEDGETPEEAAVRETAEECGLEVRLSGCLGIADELVRAASGARYYRKRCTFFRAEIVRSNGNGEADHRLLWLPPETAAARLTHMSQAWAIGKL